MNSVSSVVETSLATGYNQWFTDYRHRDTERTEDSQRTRLFYNPLETARNQHFQKVLEMEAPEELRGLARDGLREMAARELKARGPRMDAVFYLLAAMRLFRGKSLQEVQEITFEIGMLGQCGLDINDPQESHVLRALPGSGC